jgi:beta-carotene 3-hydroxylase
MILDIAIVIATAVLMEVVAALTHRHIMHGRAGWRLHQDHHAPRAGRFERNDLYGVGFAIVGFLLFLAGNWLWPLTQVALGMTLYGFLYAVVHDGLVHRRWPFAQVPRRGYLRRLYQAHLLHHATRERTGAVSFGFLYAPPTRDLRVALARRSGRTSPEV